MESSLTPSHIDGFLNLRKSVTLEGKEKGGLKVWSERGLGRRTEVSMDDGGLKTEAWDKRRRC